MSLPSRPRVWGLVLAGGQSRRFTHGAKALEPLGDRPLVAHVLRRLQPQVEDLWISSGPGPLSMEELPEALRKLPCLPDPEPRFRGPLAGLAVGLAAMHRAVTARAMADDAPAWLQLAPCDAPFLPTDMVERLFGDEPLMADPACRVRVPRLDGHLQPTFAAWHASTLEAVEGALAQRGGAGLLEVLRGLPHRVVDWPAATPPPFFNVNTREDLDEAAHWLQSGVEPRSP